MSHFGMAGHYAAMSEFLYRGYNVAVPSVDIGDDVYVVEDHEGTMWRLQVKTSEQSGNVATPTAAREGIYSISRAHLVTQKANELYFMFMFRWDMRWRFILIGREQLELLRSRHEAGDRSGKPGRPPTTDGKSISLKITWTEGDAELWDESLFEYLDQWSEETFPEIRQRSAHGE